MEPASAWLWDAWRVLGAGRGWAGGGMGPMIPLAVAWTAVEDYADRLGVCPDEREMLHKVVAALDARWLELEMARIRSEAARK